MKSVHNQMGIQPPHSPISPYPPEVVIPLVEERIQNFVSSDVYDQYGSMFYAPPPAQPAMGFDAIFGGGSSSQTAETSSYEWVPPPPSDEWAARLSLDLFGMPPPSHGTVDTPIVSFSEITVSDSISLNSPML